jgi:histidine triad (HIT) family protein
MSRDCLFCRIAAKQIPADIVHEDDETIAFRDINPQAPTHLLIIPKEHIETLNDLEPSHDALVGRLVLRARALAASEAVDERGYRLVLNCLAEAGQSVYHVHLHLLGGRPMAWPPG